MPNFKENPNGMKPSGFKMKNSALNMSARTGSPMQSNYNKPSPAKVWPIVAKIVAGAAKAAKAVKAAGGIKAAAKAGVKSAGKAIAKGAKVAKAGVKTAKKAIVEDYKTGGITKTLADSAVEGAVNTVVAPREEEDTSIIKGEQKNIM